MLFEPSPADRTRSGSTLEAAGFWSDEFPDDVLKEPVMNACETIPTQDHELIESCVSRIVGLTIEIERAWEIGIPHGEHREPWSLGFQEVAVGIYLETIPPAYALRVAANFERCTTLLNKLEPSTNAWTVVACYWNSVATATHHLLGGETICASTEFETLLPTTPGLFPYDKIARIAHPQGVSTLRSAAEELNRGHLAPGFARPSPSDTRILQWLTEGKSILGISGLIGCSERTLYRRLRELCDRLGVVSTKEAILLAGQHGWFEVRS